MEFFAQDCQLLTRLNAAGVFLPPHLSPRNFPYRFSLEKPLLHLFARKNVNFHIYSRVKLLIYTFIRA